MNKSAQKYKNQERQALSDQKDVLFKYKKEWNASSKNFLSQMKEFNSELIEFKKLFNGRVEGGEKIKLYQPLPESVYSKLNHLSESLDQKAYLFSQIADQASRIMNYQFDYSKKYNSFYSSLEEKRKANLAKPASYQDYNLISEGISPMGITWESIKSFFGDKKDSIRISLLKQFFNIDQKVSLLQKEILDARSYQDVAKAKAKLIYLSSVLRSLYHTLSFLSSRQKREEVGLDEFETASKSKITTKPEPTAATPIAIEEKKLSAVPIPEIDIRSENKKICESISAEIPAILFCSSWLEGEVNQAAVNRIRQTHLPKLAELIEIANRNNFNQTQTGHVLTEYRFIVNNLLPNKNIYPNDFNNFKNLMKRIQSKVASSNYAKIIKYANDNPYDPTLMRLKKLLSKFGLKFKVFFEIKGNLEQLSNGCDQLRKNLSFIINSLQRPDVNYQELAVEVKDANNIVNDLTDFATSTQGILKEDVSQDDMSAISKIEDAVGKSRMRSLIGKMFSDNENETVKAKR